jgi:hypothetical protein
MRGPLTWIRYVSSFAVQCVCLMHSHCPERAIKSCSASRCGVRLLMSSASLSPADFASPVGCLGPSESTPYYPTGDLQRDRTVAFTTALDCLDHMDVHVHESDGVRIATTLLELAQALSKSATRVFTNTHWIYLVSRWTLSNVRPSRAQLQLSRRFDTVSAGKYSV